MSASALWQLSGHLPPHDCPWSPSVCVLCSSESWCSLECPEQLSMWPPPNSLFQTPAEGPRPQCGPSVIQPWLTHPSLHSHSPHLPLFPPAAVPTMLSQFYQAAAVLHPRPVRFPQLLLTIYPFISPRPPLMSSSKMTVIIITPLRIRKKHLQPCSWKSQIAH